MKCVLLLMLTCCLAVAMQAQNKVLDVSTYTTGLDLSQSKYGFTYGDAYVRTQKYKRSRFNWRRRAVVGKRYDAGSCWFDLDKIEIFKKDINTMLQLIDPKDHVTGLRFYYITYTRKDPHAPSEIWNATNGKMRKIHTLLIVATHIMPKTGETDVVSSDGTRLAALVVVREKAGIIGGGTTTFENGGTLCPPEPASACGGATLINELYPPRP